MKLYLENYAGHATCVRQMPYWKKMGVKIVNSPQGADIHLSNVRTSGPRGAPVVQRLDGIYYDSDTPWKTRNSAISATHRMATGIIYQSEYCKEAGEYYLDKRRGPYRVIYNGIEPGWAGKREISEHPTIVVSAKWRRHKRLPEILSLFKEYQKSYPKSQLTIMGDLRGSPDPSGIHGVRYVGHISHKLMREYFRRSWFSIHLSKRDACPNSTVEAIGAGVPVITTNACGGGTEMCNMTEGCIVVDGDEYTIEPVPHYRDKYNKLSKVLRKGLLDSMIRMTENLPEIVMPVKLTAEHQAHEYISFMKSLL